MSRASLASRLRRGPVLRLVEQIAARTGLAATVVLVIVAAGLVVAAAGFGFTKVLDDVMEGDGIAGADPAVQRFVVEHRSAGLTDAFRVITWLGSAIVVATFVVVVVIFLVRRHDHLLALGVTIAAIGGALLVQVIKVLVDRTRPPALDRLVDAPGASFPSGHSAQAILCYGALACVFTSLTSSRRLHVATWTGALVVALLVGFSRVYLGVHWASDVLSGWFVGTAWLAVSIAACALIRALLVDRRPIDRGAVEQGLPDAGERPERGPGSGLVQVEDSRCATIARHPRATRKDTMAAHGSAEWKGDLPTGAGTFIAGDDITGGYTFKSRFEDGPGSNPEQLIAAAHAACFSMSLANLLAQAGHPADSVQTNATVTLRRIDDKPTIAKVELVTVGRVPGLDEDTFVEHAQAAKVGCPVSRALASVPEITLEASLAE
jgi:lipoyl-dependent peroxiredoxin